jgi:hypothetical protein
MTADRAPGPGARQPVQSDGNWKKKPDKGPE